MEINQLVNKSVYGIQRETLFQISAAPYTVMSVILLLFSRLIYKELIFSHFHSRHIRVFVLHQ